MSSLILIFDWTVSTTIRASVLVLAVLILQRLLRSHLSPKWKYSLWSPVLVVMLVPAQPLLPHWMSSSANSTLAFAAGGDARGWFDEFPDRATEPGSFDETPISSSSGAGATEFAVEGSESNRVLERQRTRTESSVVSTSVAPASENPAISSNLPRMPSWRSILACIWFSGLVCLTAGILIAYWKTLRRIVCDSSPIDTSQRMLVDRLAAETGLRCSPRVLLSSAVQTPAVCGALRPTLLLNANFFQALTLQEASFILRHELTHIRRGDLLLNGLICLLLALHWFNPLFWYAFFRARADREAACDEDVLRHESKEARLAYGTTLLKMETAFPPPGLCLGFVGMLHGKQCLQERIHFISNPKSVPASLRTVLTTCLIAAVVLGVTKAAEPQVNGGEVSTALKGTQSKGSVDTAGAADEDEGAPDAKNADAKNADTKNTPLRFRKVASVPTKNQHAFKFARIAFSAEHSSVISRNYIVSNGEDVRSKIGAHLWSLNPDDPKQTKLPDSTTFGFIPKSDLGYQIRWGSGVQFWNTRTHKVSGGYIPHELREDTTMGPAVSPDGRVMATRSQLDHLRFWDIGKRKPISEEIKQPGVIYGLQFSADGKWLFCRTSRQMRVYHARTGKLVAGPLRDDTNSYAYLAKNGLLVTCENTREKDAPWACRIVIRSGETFKSIRRIQLAGLANSVKWVGESHLVLITDNQVPRRRFGQKTLQVIALGPGKLKTQQLFQHFWIKGLDVSADGEHFISRTREGTSCWKVGREDLVWSRVGDNLASFGGRDWVLLHDGIRNGTLTAYEVATGKELWSAKDVDKFRVDGGTIWTCNEQKMEVWKVTGRRGIQP